MKQKIIFIISLLIIIFVLFALNFSNKNEELKELGRKEIRTGISAGIANPSSVYCQSLGYNTRIEKTGEGEVAYCIFPDGTECRSWAFYAGKCGEKWSYCVQQGYDIKTIREEHEGKYTPKDPYSPYVYAICVDKETKKEIGLVVDLTNLRQKLTSDSSLSEI